MACNQRQIKAEDFPWTVERAAALMREARTDFIDKGITDFNDIVDGIAARHNLPRSVIVQGFTKPRGLGRALSDDMWIKVSAQRKITNAAKQAILEPKHNEFVRRIGQLAEAPRRILLAAHFGAFTKSHLSDQIFYNPDVYAKNFTRSWALATKRGIAAHEARLAAAFDPKDPIYQLELRSGLNVGEGGYGSFAKETKEVTGIGKIFSKAYKSLPKGLRERLEPDRAAMAFDELRMSRDRIFRKEYWRMSPEERGNLDQVKAVSESINHDTGTIARGNRALRFIFLSPRLLPAQLAHTYADIPRALIHTGMGFNYSKAAPAMRYVARKSAILAGGYTAMLAANYGIGKAVGLVTGDKKLEQQFTPNLGQEGLGRRSLLRPKLFGYSIPVSPTVELLKLPVMMIAAGAAARKGENRIVEALKVGMQTIVGRQNPLFDIIEQAIFGQEVATGRPTPFPGLVGTTAPTRTAPKMTWGQWAGQRLPIPVANYVAEFYDEATANGVPSRTALDLTKMMIAPTIELGTSYHLSPERERKSKTKKQKTGIYVPAH